MKNQESIIQDMTLNRIVYVCVCKHACRTPCDSKPKKLNNNNKNRNKNKNKERTEEEYRGNEKM